MRFNTRRDPRDEESFVYVSVLTSNDKARASIMQMEVASRKNCVGVMWTHQRLDCDSRGEI